MKSYIVFLSALMGVLTSCESEEGNTKGSSSAAPYTGAAWQKQVDDIDQQILKLTNQRNLHLARATRLQNQGDRLQFNNETLIDARMAWQQAQIDREIADRLQAEIDVLEGKRVQILNSNGVKEYPSRAN